MLQNQKVIKVAAKRLDHFDIEGGEIVLKIDVEGHEYNVLQGAEQLFKQRRIKAVYIDGYDNKQILPFLKGYGFNFVDAHTLQEVKDDTFSLLALLDSNQRLV